MKWRDLIPGTIVYHRIFTHWGKGVVQTVQGVDCLESLFERGKWRAIVKFEAHDNTSRMTARELCAKPNRKKIKDMIALYARRGVEAKDGGDKLILPNEPTPTDTSP